MGVHNKIKLLVLPFIILILSFCFYTNLYGA